MKTTIFSLAAAAALVLAGSTAWAGGSAGNEDVNSYSGTVSNSAVGAGSFAATDGNGAAFNVSGGVAGAKAVNHGGGVAAWEGYELGNVEIGGTIAKSANVSGVLTGAGVFSYGDAIGGGSYDGGAEAGADGYATGITEAWSQYGDIETD